MPNTDAALCKTTTTTVGTADYVLSTALNSGPHRTPKQAVTAGSLSDGDTVHYICRDSTVTGNAVFEEGIGIYTDATNKVARIASNVLDNGEDGPGTLKVWGASGQRDFLILESIHPDRANTFLKPTQFDDSIIVDGVVTTSGSITAGAGLLVSVATVNLTKTSTAADPTTTEYPNSGDVGVHHNTASGNRFFAWNDGGTIFKVQVT